MSARQAAASLAEIVAEAPALTPADLPANQYEPGANPPKPKTRC